ncbi:helix-turn-helix transcriptional regulator [Chryseobacterium sp. SL1]|uniref:helix-turn-helix transcriptional regulator n=1 Tax=Chryseobacterium sp. SL1 TaxID=2995159 RepID=UPI002275EA0C|nr:hypothetical protein [Chryseobacterium sp. SL1]MCY1660205.1 hypothetical protein [Chryseobacterium sp. SL1]
MNFFHKIVNLDLSELKDLSDKENFKLINVFTFLVLIEETILMIIDFSYGPSYSFYVKVIICFIVIGGLYLPKLRFNKHIIFLLYLIFILEIFFGSSYWGEESMVYLYNIPLVVSLPFIFQQKKDFKYVIIITIIVLVLLFINFYTQFKLFNFFNLSRNSQKDIRNIAFSYIFTVLIIFAYLFYIKFRNIQSLLKENLEKSLLLEKSKTIINLEELQAFIIQAKESNDGFVVKFNSYFPDFIVKLTNIAPTLIATEIEICAMLKLNFTTKEIAASTNSTVLAINRKKNRVRNKLNIPSEINLNTWFVDF